MQNETGAESGIEPRESMSYDIVIVGAGPAGLACAIHLKQIAGDSLSVCVLEKGSSIGAHILSGAVLEPRALNELFPDAREKGAPLGTPATYDRMVFLTARRALRLPTPPQMNNHGNSIISLGKLTQWMGEQAQALGVEIYPGFAATEVLYDHSGAVCGVATGDMGRDRTGHPTAAFTRGVELRARQTVFAEGCHGSLSLQIIKKFDLRQGRSPQTHALGIKEIWEVTPDRHRPGHVLHTIGWPLKQDTYGGSFLYHYGQNLVSLGLVVGLDYRNPFLSPFDEMQRFKTHPAIRSILEGGRRISYGARTLVEGGFQSLPKLAFPGGVLIGDTAGFLNVPKIKGIHTAMKSGMVAAQSLAAHLKAGKNDAICTAYPEALEKSWIWPELRAVRNIRPGFRAGLWPGLLNAAFETLTGGWAPWTLRNHADHTSLKKADKSKPIAYPKPDGVLTFDKMSSVYLSNTNHTEDQPCHLILKDPTVPITRNLPDYAEPAQRYCPAGVYEIVTDSSGTPKFQINAQNCVHCKTCDIKDPTQNIVWTPPQGGEGPDYQGM